MALIYPNNINDKPRLKLTALLEQAVNTKSLKSNIKVSNIDHVILALPNDLQDQLNQNWQENTAYDMKQMNVGKAVINHVVKKLADTLGEPIKNSISLTKRVALNPHTEVLYNSPSFRQFSFSWVFQPRSAQESKTVYNIIKFFRMYSVPSLTGNNPDITNEFSEGAGTNTSSSIIDFMEYPPLWKVEVLPGGGEKTSTPILKFKDMVIESVQLNYTTEGALLLLKNGMPASISLTLNMKEVKWLTREDVVKGF